VLIVVPDWVFLVLNVGLLFRRIQGFALNALPFVAQAALAKHSTRLKVLIRLSTVRNVVCRIAPVAGFALPVVHV